MRFVSVDDVLYIEKTWPVRGEGEGLIFHGDTSQGLALSYWSQAFVCLIFARRGSHVKGLHFVSSGDEYVVWRAQMEEAYMCFQAGLGFVNKQMHSGDCYTSHTWKKTF